MPSYQEIKELCTCCFLKWTDNYKGSHTSGYCVFKAKKNADCGKILYSDVVDVNNNYSFDDIHIFLPAAGWRGYTKIYNIGALASYWSSQLSPVYSKSACRIRIARYWRTYDVTDHRYYGESVRPVCKVD